MAHLAGLRQLLLLSNVLGGGDGVVQQRKLLGAAGQYAQILKGDRHVLLSEIELQRDESVTSTKQSSSPNLLSVTFDEVRRYGRCTVSC